LREGDVYFDNPSFIQLFDSKMLRFRALFRIKIFDQGVITGCTLFKGSLVSLEMRTMISKKRGLLSKRADE
jgi:hypothetical protein